MIWNKEIECADRKTIEEIQLRNLKNTVEKVSEHPFYKPKFEKMGITADKIKSVSDIKYLPFSKKTDLRDNYPFGMMNVPMKKIVRVHASSGTTGKPTVVGYTKADIDMWSECMARLVTAGGVTDEDIVQNAFGYGLFTGAFGLHYAMEKIGATVVPTSSGNTEKQIMLMQDFKSTVLISTPSYALYISEVMEEMGVDMKNIHLKYGLFGAEGSTEEMREQIEKRLGIIATENYGLSEIIGPGVAGECVNKCGMHINEDNFIIEIINPETGEPVPLGETGEVVISAVTKEALPMIRYRTGDISKLIPEPCPCGRTSYRLAKIMGRSDDMLIIKGVNVFPSQVESVLVGMNHIGPHYQLVVTKKGVTDALEVKVELIDASILESFSMLEALEKEIKHKIRVVLGIDAKVSLVEPKSLERFTGKAKRVLDLR